MEKKIIELSLTETQAVVGGIRLATTASLSVSANSMTYQPATQVSLSPSRFEALLAKR